MRVLVRGGGDLASGAVIRMRRAGWMVLVTEVAQPLAVRRLVSFAQAVYDGSILIEDVAARRVTDIREANAAMNNQQVAVMVDPEAACAAAFQPHAIIDARMTKQSPGQPPLAGVPLIGLGPGFWAGQDCTAVVETNRGPFLGRVIWDGPAEADTGIPEKVMGYGEERVLRAPANGALEALCEIGTLLRAGDPVARVAGKTIDAPFDGSLRGLLYAGVYVNQGMKVGDVDPRGDVRLCRLVSDKALAIGGGVLEAVLACMAQPGR